MLDGNTKLFLLVFPDMEEILSDCEDEIWDTAAQHILYIINNLNSITNSD